MSNGKGWIICNLLLLDSPVPRKKVLIDIRYKWQLCSGSRQTVLWNSFHNSPLLFSAHRFSSHAFAVFGKRSTILISDKSCAIPVNTTRKYILIGVKFLQLSNALERFFDIKRDRLACRRDYKPYQLNFPPLYLNTSH